MALPPEEIRRLRDLGRERRRMPEADARRAELSGLGIVDTGMLTDEEVIQALAVYRAGLVEENDGRL